MSFLRPLFLVLLVAGCADAPPPPAQIVVIDDVGHEVRLAQPARRIISLIPARTDALRAMGAGDRLVARTQWDTASSLVHLPSLGDALTPSVEWIVAQRPDLVIAWPDAGSRSTITRLRELGVPVYASGVETLADLRSALVDLGAMTGLEARADSVLRDMDAALDSARSLVAGREKLRALYLVGVDPPVAAGPGTLVHELLEIAGAENVLADADAPWPNVSLEVVIERDPDVVIVAVGEARVKPLAERAGWSALRAVRERRVHVIDPYEFNRPGPSAGRLALELVALLHP